MEEWELNTTGASLSARRARAELLPKVHANGQRLVGQALDEMTAENADETILSVRRAAVVFSFDAEMIAADRQRATTRYLEVTGRQPVWPDEQQPTPRRRGLFSRLLSH